MADGVITASIAAPCLGQSAVMDAVNHTLAYSTITPNYVSFSLFPKASRKPAAASSRACLP